MERETRQWHLYERGQLCLVCVCVRVPDLPLLHDDEAKGRHLLLSGVHLCAFVK